MKTRFIAFLCATFLTSAPAFASFLGHTVSADYVWPTSGTVIYPSGTAVVGPGVEFPDIGQFGVGSSPNVDFSATNILITYPVGWTLGSASSFDGWVFTDFTASSIVGATLAGTNLSGLTNARLTFDANRVYLDTRELGNLVSGLYQWDAGTFISVDVAFANNVPEPQTLALVSLALGLIGFGRMRRQLKR